jgi:hypothetical protein
LISDFDCSAVCQCASELAGNTCQFTKNVFNSHVTQRTELLLILSDLVKLQISTHNVTLNGVMQWVAELKDILQVPSEISISTLNLISTLTNNILLQNTSYNNTTSINISQIINSIIEVLKSAQNGYFYNSQDVTNTVFKIQDLLVLYSDLLTQNLQIGANNTQLITENYRITSNLFSLFCITNDVNIVTNGVNCKLNTGSNLLTLQNTPQTEYEILSKQYVTVVNATAVLIGQNDTIPSLNNRFAVFFCSL